MQQRLCVTPGDVHFRRKKWGVDDLFSSPGHPDPLADATPITQLHHHTRRQSRRPQLHHQAKRGPSDGEGEEEKKKKKRKKKREKAAEVVEEEEDDVDDDVDDDVAEELQEEDKEGEEEEDREVEDKAEDKVHNPQARLLGAINENDSAEVFVFFFSLHFKLIHASLILSFYLFFLIFY